MTAVLAIDIGGTKIAAARYDGEQLLETHVLPTVTGKGADAAWSVVEALIDRIVGPGDDGRPPIEAVGIGSAGPIDRAAGTISPVNIADWRDFPVVDRAAATLARHGCDVPVGLFGDGACAALGELAHGAARGADSALVMVVSTGIGGGVVVGGQVVLGRTGSAGHVGHVPVVIDGRRCACGGSGCPEAYGSGPSMVRRATEIGWAAPPGATGRELVAAVRTGDPAAVEAFDEGARAVAAAIVSSTALLEHEVAVLGGGIMNAGDLLLPRVRRHVDELTGFDYVRAVRIEPARLGSNAGLYGAGVGMAQPSLVSSGPLSSTTSLEPSSPPVVTRSDSASPNNIGDR